MNFSKTMYHASDLVGTDRVIINQDEYVGYATLDDLWDNYLEPKIVDDGEMFVQEDRGFVYLHDLPIFMNDQILKEVADAEEDTDVVNLRVLDNSHRTLAKTNCDPFSIGCYNFTNSLDTLTVNSTSGYFPTLNVSGTTDISEFYFGSHAPPYHYCKFKTNDYLSYWDANADFYLPYPFAVSFWIYPQTPTVGAEDTIINIETNNASSGANAQFSVTVTTNSDGYGLLSANCNCNVDSNPTVTDYNRTSPFTISQGLWSFCIVNFGETVETSTYKFVRMYLNGPHRLSGAFIMDDFPTFENKGYKIEIGKPEDSTGNNWIGDVRIYNRLIELDEMEGMYRNEDLYKVDNPTTPEVLYERGEIIGSNTSGLVLNSDSVSIHCNNNVPIFVSNNSVVLSGDVFCSWPTHYRAPATKDYVDRQIALLASQNALTWP